MATSGRIELDKLSVEQLKGLKEQTDLEVNLLHDSLNKIRTAITRLESASAALQDLSLRPHGAYPLAASFPASRAPFPRPSGVDWWLTLSFMQGRRCLCRSRRPSTCPARLTTPRRSSSTSALVTSSR